MTSLRGLVKESIRINAILTILKNRVAKNVFSKRRSPPSLLRLTPQALWQREGDRLLPSALLFVLTVSIRGYTE